MLTVLISSPHHEVASTSPSNLPPPLLLEQAYVSRVVVLSRGKNFLIIVADKKREWESHGVYFDARFRGQEVCIGRFLDLFKV